MKGNKVMDDGLSEHDRAHLGMMGLKDFGTGDLSSWWEAYDELGTTDTAEPREDHGKGSGPQNP